MGGLPPSNRLGRHGRSLRRVRAATHHYAISLDAWRWREILERPFCHIDSRKHAHLAEGIFAARRVLVLVDWYTTPSDVWQRNFRCGYDQYDL